MQIITLLFIPDLASTNTDLISMSSAQDEIGVFIYVADNIDGG